MTSDNVDTVTPLDGDGTGVTGIDEQFQTDDQIVLGDPTTGNVSAEAYDTQGRTTVATRRGYEFASADKDVPVVTHAGLVTTKEQAEALVEESDGLVHIIQNEED